MLVHEGVHRALVAAPQVAAGAGVTVQVPGADYQELIAVAFRLVTSAVVGNRTPKVSVVGGDNVFVCSVAAGFATTAGTTVDYSFCYGLHEWDSAGTTVASGPCPNLPLEDGDTVTVTVDGIDAGDQLSRVRVTLLQRDEPAY